MKNNNQTTINYSILILSFFLLILPGVSAKLQLDNVQFDPAIIASGDEVDIVVQFRDIQLMGDEDKIGDPDYTYQVLLKPDDTLTDNYVTFQDAKGDNLYGVIYSGGVFNKKFRVKVNNNAPAGNYEFKLVGQWYKKGKPLVQSEYIKFKMPVKKEGIIIDISTIQTIPSEVRPGDNYVKVNTFIENTGEKDAKSVEINLDLPKGFESSYANNNRVWVGRVNAGEKQEVVFYLDVDDDTKEGVYDINYKFKYMDLDSNSYQKSRTIPFKIKSRPYIEVLKSEGEGLAGKDAKLYVTLKNTGTETAESVDVRLLKENSQPFDFDVRSNYVGELDPGEEGVAIFNIKVNSNAEIKEHDFKVMIRAKGDSDEGDDNIYTFSRRAKLDITGVAPNYFVKYGIISAIIVILLLGINIFIRKKK